MSAKVRRPRSSVGRDRTDRAVVMPPESYGLCRIRTCYVIGDLAAGLCVTHWDKGFDKRDSD